jgi:hypothetical protein
MATGSCSRHIPYTSSNAANSRIRIVSTPTGRVWSLLPASRDLRCGRHSRGIPATGSGSSSHRSHQIAALFRPCPRIEGKLWLSRRLARMEPGSRAPKDNRVCNGGNPDPGNERTGMPGVQWVINSHWLPHRRARIRLRKASGRTLAARPRASTTVAAEGRGRLPGSRA